MSTTNTYFQTIQADIEQLKADGKAIEVVDKLAIHLQELNTKFLAKQGLLLEIAAIIDGLNIPSKPGFGWVLTNWRRIATAILAIVDLVLKARQ